MVAKMEVEKYRSRVGGFLYRVKRELNPTVRITANDILALLDRAARERLNDREYKADVREVFGNVCIHAIYGYTNECGKSKGVFGAVILHAHPTSQPCYNAWKTVDTILWCG